MSSIANALLKKDIVQITQLLDQDDDKMMMDIVEFLFQHEPACKKNADDIFYDPDILKVLFPKIKDVPVVQDTFDKYLVDMVITQGDVNMLKWMFEHSPRLATGNGRTEGRGSFFDSALSVVHPNIQIIEFLSEFFEDEGGAPLVQAVYSNDVEKVKIILPYSNTFSDHSYAYQCAWTYQREQLQELLETVSNPERALYGMLCDPPHPPTPEEQERIYQGAIALSGHIAKKNLRMSAVVQNVIDNQDVSESIKQYSDQEKSMLTTVGMLFKSIRSVESVFDAVPVIWNTQALEMYIKHQGAQALVRFMDKIHDVIKTRVAVKFVEQGDRCNAMVLLAYTDIQAVEQSINTMNWRGNMDEAKQNLHVYLNEMQRTRIAKELDGNAQKGNVRKI